MKAGKATFLLINSGEKRAGIGRKLVRRPAKQLSLSFPSSNVVIAAIASSLSKESFSQLILENPPVWLFDLRSFPRLDRFVGSRSDALRKFTKNGTNYVDLYGLIGASSRTSLQRNPVVWMPVVKSLIADSKLKTGPIVALFETSEELQNSATYLVEAISQATHQKIELAIHSA